MRDPRINTMTPLSKIREVLDDYDRTSTYAAGKLHNLSPRTIQRWVTRRDQLDPAWPTPDDIAAWDADYAANGAARAANAEKCYRYRHRVYLNAGTTQRPALGTTRRLQALFALGWTERELGDELGCSPARVGHLVTGKFPTVYESTARAVADLYDRLNMTVPVEHAPAGRGRVMVHQRNRNLARRRGYAPPLAWDDIDDPAEQPKHKVTRRKSDVIDEATVGRIVAGEIVDSTRAEKFIATARWIAAGQSSASLHKLNGWPLARYSPTNMPENLRDYDTREDQSA